MFWLSCDCCVDCFHYFEFHGVLWWPSYSHRGPLGLTEYVEAARLHLQPKVSSKSFLYIFNHALLYSCLRFSSFSSHLAYLLRPASTFPFPYLFEVLSSLCISDICTQSHLNCHSASFLIGVRRALADPRESRGLTVSSPAGQSSHQNTTLSKTVSPLTLKVHSALVGLVRCR